MTSTVCMKGLILQGVTCGWGLANIQGSVHVHPGQVIGSMQDWHLATNNHTYPHSRVNALWAIEMNPIKLACMSFNCGGMLYLVGTHTDTGRTDKLPGLELNPSISYTNIPLSQCQLSLHFFYSVYISLRSATKISNLSWAGSDPSLPLESLYPSIIHELFSLAQF